MKKALVIFVALFSLGAFAADAVNTGAPTTSNTDSKMVVKKAKKDKKKKGKKGKKAAADAGAPAGGAPAGGQ